jgi:hypothetical protein
MRPQYYMMLVLVLLGCEDKYEDIYRYSKIVTETKEYPIYLDMSEIANIRIMEKTTMTAPFKTMSNDKYYFVGDMLRGIHVYRKNGTGASYLCFIECRYIKDFEVVNNLLFCNNFTDMVVIDVTNPLQIKLLHRQENHFNRFSGYKESWNIPNVEGKGLIVGSEKRTLTGIVTEEKPHLDFTEYDKTYANLFSKDLPVSWFSSHPENDRPYVGIVRAGTDEIYTYGTYNSWATCTFTSGVFTVKEEDYWTTPRARYTPVYYYSDAWPVRMFFADSLIYVLGNTYGNDGYADCITDDQPYFMSYHLYFSTFRPVDITYLPKFREFLILSGQSIWGAFKYSDAQPSSYMERYVDYKIPTDARSILRVGDNVLTIGKVLSVYLPSANDLQLVKSYPSISGTCYSRSGNTLAIANGQSLFLYDISDLENIKLIP